LAPGATGFASAMPIFRECYAIGSSKVQLALELNMLERRADATVRKASASRTLAEPVAPDELNDGRYVVV